MSARHFEALSWINLGNGIGVPFTTTYTEESGILVHVTLAHVASIEVVTEGDSSICELNATLSSNTVDMLDGEEMLFTSKRLPTSLSLSRHENTHLAYIAHPTFNPSLQDWILLLRNIEYFNSAPEPSLADRQVSVSVKTCSGQFGPPASTNLNIVRVNDNPPHIILNLATAIPV